MTFTQVCKELIIKEPFYGLFFLNLNKTINNNIKTMRIVLEGVNPSLEYNETWFNSLTNSQQVAVLKHEILHICFGHLTMIQSFTDRNLFHYAADIEVNQYIDGLPTDQDLLLLEKFKEEHPQLLWTKKAGTKHYYTQLSQILRQQPDHNGNGFGEHNWEEFEGLSDAERRIVDNQVDRMLAETATQIQKQRGTIPGELSTKIAELFKVEPSVFNWKAYLRRLIGNSFKVYTKKSQRKLSKRFDGSAGIKIKQKHHVLVAVDTSGSVNDKELLEFFSEITHLYKAGATVTVIECDARINKIYQYTGTFDGNIHGRGGTSFDPVIDYYNENRNKFTTLIYFTDGEAPVDHLKVFKKMMWVISSNGKTRGNYPGILIRIPKEKNQ